MRIKGYISGNKKDFPYLSGNKICNYWLYVIEQYTDCCFTDRDNITVAPDTHVIQASAKLGVISKEECSRSDVRNIVAARWRQGRFFIETGMEAVGGNGLYKRSLFETKCLLLEG